jgi:hypothetical protein
MLLDQQGLSQEATCNIILVVLETSCKTTLSLLKQIEEYSVAPVFLF